MFGVTLSFGCIIWLIFHVLNLMRSIFWWISSRIQIFNFANQSQLYYSHFFLSRSLERRCFSGYFCVLDKWDILLSRFVQRNLIENSYFLWLSITSYWTDVLVVLITSSPLIPWNENTQWKLNSFALFE